jgi:hypothetical protein
MDDLSGRVAERVVMARLAIAVVVVLAALAMSGCQQKMPECADLANVGTAAEIIRDGVKETLVRSFNPTRVTGYTQFMIEYLTPDTANLTEIRTSAVDKTVRKVTCNATANFSWRPEGRWEKYLEKISQADSSYEDFQMAEALLDKYWIAANLAMQTGSAMQITYTAQAVEGGMDREAYIEVIGGWTLDEVFLPKP